MCGSVKPWVLVVDDSPELREALCVAFERSGYCVAEAGTAREALEVLRARCEEGDDCPDALILDIDLPDIRGTTLAAKVRERYPNLVIHFLTGYPAPVFSATARRLSAGLTVKPLPSLSAFVAMVGEEIKGAGFPEDRRKRGGRNISGQRRRIGDVPLDFGEDLTRHMEAVAAARKAG